MANPTTHHVIVAVVTHEDDVSLACTTGLLRLQQLAAQRPDIHLDVHIVPTFLEALNTHAVAGDSAHAYVVVVDGMCGVSPEFVFGSVTSGLDAVAGVYPMPGVDWERVRQALHTPNGPEPIQHAGNTYNVTPDNGTFGRYVKVADVKELRVLSIKCDVLRAMAGPDISFDAADGTKKHLFAYESVFDNTFQNAYQTFARRLGDNVYADLEAPCILSAPAQFAGCVGMRGASIR